MADVVIASAGTIATATAIPQQRQLFFDGTNWWAFYYKSGTASTLFYSHSTDLSTWAETSLALTATVVETGKPMGVCYDSGTQTVLVTYDTSATNKCRYARGNISGTTISWSAVTLTFSSAIGTGNTYKGWATAIDSAGKVWMCRNGEPTTDFNPAKSTNVISTSFADTTASWTQTTFNAGNTSNYLKLFPLASACILAVFNDSVDGLEWDEWDTGAAWFGQNAISGASGLDPTLNWDGVKVSNTDIRVLTQNGASSFAFLTNNGATLGSSITWSTLTAPTWPTSGLATNSGVALLTDSTNVWAFVIRGDANKTVSYNVYSGTTWSGWTDLTSTSKTRSYIQASQNIGNNLAAILWTEVNGSNFDVHVASLSTVALPTSRMTLLGVGQ